jgi:hypothetical protein
MQHAQRSNPILQIEDILVGLLTKTPCSQLPGCDGMKRNCNSSLLILFAFMLCACGANRPLPTVAVIPSDTPRPGAVPVLTVVATIAVDTGNPTLQPPPTATLTLTPLFEPSPTATTFATIVPSATVQPILTITGNNGTAVADNREVATCQRIIELFSAIQTDEKGEFPADFPKPPDGSVACGTDGPGSVHFSNTVDARSIANYYRETLKTWGCVIAQDKVFKPNWISLRFECPKGMVHIATNPDITEFIVRYVAN